MPAAGIASHQRYQDRETSGAPKCKGRTAQNKPCQNRTHNVDGICGQCQNTQLYAELLNVEIPATEDFDNPYHRNDSERHQYRDTSRDPMNEDSDTVVPSKSQRIEEVKSELAKDSTGKFAIKAALGYTAVMAALSGAFGAAYGAMPPATNPAATVLQEGGGGALNGLTAGVTIGGATAAAMSLIVVVCATKSIINNRKERKQMREELRTLQLPEGVRALV